MMCDWISLLSSILCSPPNCSAGSPTQPLQQIWSAAGKSNPIGLAEIHAELSITQGH